MLAPVLPHDHRRSSPPLAVQSKTDITDHQAATGIGRVVLGIHEDKAPKLPLLCDEELLEVLHLFFVQHVQCNYPLMNGSWILPVTLLCTIHEFEDLSEVSSRRLGRILHHGAGLECGEVCHSHLE